MAKATFRIHLVAPMPEGPIVSDGGPVVAGPPQVHGELGRSTVGVPGRYAIACDPTLELGDGVNHGTDKTYLVACPRCKATEIFKEIAKKQTDPRRPKANVYEGPEDENHPLE